eukprot:3389034-Lingulodinium_polyedra.AAC.1
MVHNTGSGRPTRRSGQGSQAPRPTCTRCGLRPCNSTMRRATTSTGTSSPNGSTELSMCG